jgi:hypothetical protein
MAFLSRFNATKTMERIRSNAAGHQTDNGISGREATIIPEQRNKAANTPGYRSK